MRLTEVFRAGVGSVLTVEPAVECDEGEVAYLDIRLAGEEDNEDAGDSIYLKREQVGQLRDYLTELLG